MKMANACVRNEKWENPNRVKAQSIVHGSIAFPDPSFNFCDSWSNHMLYRPTAIIFPYP